MAIFVPEGSPEIAKSILKSPELKKYYKDFGKREGDLALVAEKESTTVGIVWGRLFTKKEPGYGFISEEIPEISLAVLPAYRNYGIGTRLLKEIAKHYRIEKFKAISLSVDKRSPAQKLYTREGYEFHSEEGTSETMIFHL